MIQLDGASTSVVKLQLESVLFYNLGLIQDVGSFLCSSPGSGTYTPAPGTTPLDQSLGSDVVIRANIGIQSTLDIGVTVTGTDQASSPLTGTATIKASVAEGQAYCVITAANKHFKTITGITISNGAAGDGFDVCILPAQANDVLMAFDQGISTNPGKEVKPIYQKYNLSHNKRIRGDLTISVGSFYTNNYENIARIHNRQVTLIQKYEDNGRQNVTEYIYIDKVQLGVVRDTPSGETSECNVKGDGHYGRLFIFS